MYRFNIKLNISVGIVIKFCKDISTFKMQFVWMLIQSTRLSSMTSQIRFTIWASVMNIHAFIDATRNQAATQPTSQQRYYDSWDISDHAGFCLCRSIYFSMAMWANCVGRVWPNRNNGRDYSRSICVSLCWRKWTGRWNSSYILGICRRCIRRRFIRWWWSVFMHSVHLSAISSNNSETILRSIVTISPEERRPCFWCVSERRTLGTR